MDINILQEARERAAARLMNMMDPEGHWTGRLSSSALAAAVACVALYQVNPEDEQFHRGLNWLSQVQNEDGGWGDTPESKSNLSTTLLVWAAFKPRASDFQETMLLAERWIKERTSSTEPRILTKSIIRIYGKDKTFSVPILALCALAGRLGPEPACWDLVPQLPLEAAILPQSFYRFMQLPVVSYAIPALIGIGLLRHRRGRSSWLLGGLRDSLTPRLLDIMETLQPDNGGFLEAAPLTAFVTLSLAGAGEAEHTVVRQAISFLKKSQREDGSWPIDTDLSTWVSTLSIKAFEESGQALDPDRKKQLKEWLLSQQFQEPHPFTGAAAGGWAWTHWPGAVPDADDTAGALMALSHLTNGNTDDLEQVSHGIEWLLNLQNRDGGMPTFCRGWGAMPFDRSCADLSAHALRVFLTWQDKIAGPLKPKLERGISRLYKYLMQSQHADGHWLPLWFGHQNAHGESNPLYGTAQVIFALENDKLKDDDTIVQALNRAQEYILSQQNEDGGWGAHLGVASSVEETALALSALASHKQANEALKRGAHWLVSRNEAETLKSSPIGLYFASLWYDEAAYPAIFTLQALGRLCQRNWD